MSLQAELLYLEGNKLRLCILSTFAKVSEGMIESSV